MRLVWLPSSLVRREGPWGHCAVDESRASSTPPRPLFPLHAFCDGSSDVFDQRDVSPSLIQGLSELTCYDYVNVALFVAQDSSFARASAARALVTAVNPTVPGSGP